MLELPTTSERETRGGDSRPAFCSPSGQFQMIRGRVLVWFSCGAASAAAAKLAVDKYRNDGVEVLYCDTLKYESPDNPRFMRDVEQWLQSPIKILSSKEYADIFDVFDKTGWLVGPKGARCTTELKKNVRNAYQDPADLHIFGLCADEKDRITEFEHDNPEIWLEWNLRDAGLTKRNCLQMVADAGIKLPLLYRQGYKNNNCIGCVKGQMGYWNKIRVDYPDAFARMAAQERKMNVAICKRYEGKTRIPVFLDELPPDAGRYEEEPDIECGPQCRAPELEEARMANVCVSDGPADAHKSPSSAEGPFAARNGSTT